MKTCPQLHRPSLAGIFALVLLNSPAVGQPSATSQTSPEDPLLTVAQVREEKELRRVELEPFRPVPYLQAKLADLPPVNREIVRDMLAYPRTGQHTYFWPRKGQGPAYDGCTTDVLLAGQTVLKGEPQGRTFCCGLTLEVAYRALARQPRLPEALTSATTSQFKRLWFCTAIDAPGPEDALLAFGIGDKISDPDQALPGDFVQIWRHNKSGHSVMFVAWARDQQGKRVGLHYWSTQDATEGIGFRTELFGDSGKAMKKERLSITRMLPPEGWKKLTSEQVLSKFKSPASSGK